MAKILMQKDVTIEHLQEGVEFEVEADDQVDSSDESFDDEAYAKFKFDIVDTEGKNKPRFLGGSNVPFHVLKEKMTPITDDGLVLKEVLKNGVGIPIPDKSVVLLHYDAYIEDRKEPFDSSRFRNRPYKFLVGVENVIPGLEFGVQSMKKDEIARFIVSYQYAYGAMGCPPRIPPEAEILYEVEIMNYYVSKDAIEFEEMTPEDQKKAPFEKIVGVYHCENQMANDLFHQSKYKPATNRYRRVMNLLEKVSVENEADDEKRKEYLVKLYLNLSLCYIKDHNPHKAIIYADLALKFDPENPKGLYRMGYSLLLTEDYERAKSFLNRAKKHKPYEKYINAAIKDLERKIKEHQDWERMFCRRMMGSAEEASKLITLQESDEFISVIDEELKNFIKLDDQELVFSPGYTENQLDVVKTLALKYNLAFVSKIQCGHKINKVAKRKSSP